MTYFIHRRFLLFSDCTIFLLHSTKRLFSVKGDAAQSNTHESRKNGYWVLLALVHCSDRQNQWPHVLGPQRKPEWMFVLT